MSHDPREFIGFHAVQILDEFADLVQIVSTEGAILYVNRAWCARLGYSAEDALGLTFMDLIHPEHQTAWKSLFKSVVAGARLEHFEMIVVAKNGSMVPVDGTVWSLLTGEGRPYSICATLRDSAARTLGEQRVSRLLYRDEQTGLLNRRGLAVRGAQLLEVVEDNRERLGAWMLHLDIDNLAQIERRHGDEAAREAIELSVDLLHRALRAHDLVARLTVNAFAALVTLPPRYQPSYVTARIRGGLTLANRQAGKLWNVELAMGLASVPSGMNVDQALAAAKAEADRSAGRKA